MSHNRGHYQKKKTGATWLKFEAELFPVIITRKHISIRERETSAQRDIQTSVNAQRRIHLSSSPNSNKTYSGISIVFDFVYFNTSGMAGLVEGNAVLRIPTPLETFTCICFFSFSTIMLSLLIFLPCTLFHEESWGRRSFTCTTRGNRSTQKACCRCWFPPPSTSR